MQPATQHFSVMPTWLWQMQQVYASGARRCVTWKYRSWGSAAMPSTSSVPIFLLLTPSPDDYAMIGSMLL